MHGFDVVVGKDELVEAKPLQQEQLYPPMVLEQVEFRPQGSWSHSLMSMRVFTRNILAIEKTSLKYKQGKNGQYKKFYCLYIKSTLKKGKHRHTNLCTGWLH